MQQITQHAIQQGGLGIGITAERSQIVGLCQLRSHGGRHRQGHVLYHKRAPSNQSRQERIKGSNNRRDNPGIFKLCRYHIDSLLTKSVRFFVVTGLVEAPDSQTNKPRFKGTRRNCQERLFRFFGSFFVSLTVVVVLFFLVSGAFFWMSLIFAAIFFLGRFPFGNELQAYLLIIFYAIPIAFLGILPNAVLADIAEHDAQQSGVRQEGMFFAVRTLMQKCGQTLGVFVFAILTSFGKDPGNDLGIRLSGIVGAVLCLIAGAYFLRYGEKELLAELQDTP